MSVKHYDKLKLKEVSILIHFFYLHFIEICQELFIPFMIGSQNVLLSSDYLSICSEIMVYNLVFNNYVIGQKFEIMCKPG